MRSPISRRWGRGGKIHSFCAMYSLMMSVCSVPSSRSHGTPCRSAVARKNANATTAGPLIVMEVEMSPSGMPSNRVTKSSSVSVGDAAATDLALGARVVGVEAHQRRHVERDRQAALAVLEQEPVSRVRLGGRSEPGELPHRPQPPAVHRRVHAPRERVLAGRPSREAGSKPRGPRAGTRVRAARRRASRTAFRSRPRRGVAGFGFARSRPAATFRPSAAQAAMSGGGRLARIAAAR